MGVALECLPGTGRIQLRPRERNGLGRREDCLGDSGANWEREGRAVSRLRQQVDWVGQEESTLKLKETGKVSGAGRVLS